VEAVAMARKAIPLISSKYTGTLAAPLFEPRDKGAKVRLKEQIYKKLDILLSFYKIDPNAEDKWEQLALYLALAHVRGMFLHSSPPLKPGRKKTWQSGLGDNLLHDVEAVRQEKSVRLKEAIEILRKDRGKPWHKYGRNTLLARHRDAKRRLNERQHRLAKALMSAGGGLFDLGKAGLAGVEVTGRPISKAPTKDHDRQK
jgi:hypothetical protein